METSNYTSKNRLADQISPYLLQHAKNPVHWQPWDDTALQQAKELDKPIFLSIGYAACHWCHVMEQESFESASIAAFMNEHYVNIKVDREERPDLDDIYMRAVVAMTGQGGWPMSVFLTPDLAPFYGGTYFPPEKRYGMPGFRDVIEQIAAYWKADRSRLFENATRLTELIRQHSIPVVVNSDMNVDEWIDEAVETLHTSYDAENGGWSDAPKFPSSAAIRLLLRHYQRTGAQYCLSMVTKTLDKMRCGGIYDQLGGGFHRYSVDEAWHVPHFEKMLYDNAQLAVAYLEAWQVTKNEDYRVVATETLDYLLRDMQNEAGGFYASQDADSEGGEGSYYLWEYEEVIKHLGAEPGKRFCENYGVNPGGNFSSNESSHYQKNVLLLQDSNAVDDTGREVLLKVRQARSAPACDDKVLTSWNALIITAFSRAALAFNSEVYLNAAVRAGMFLRESQFSNGLLKRSWRNGRAHLAGYLDDYAAFANACVDLYMCSADFSWITFARTLVDAMIQDFHNEQSGGFYATSVSHKHLLVRMQPLQDTAEPSGNAMAAHVLLRLGNILGEEEYIQLAEQIIRVAAAKMGQVPAAFLNLLLAADMFRYGPDEIIFTGNLERELVSSFLQVAGVHFLPNKVIVYGGEQEHRKGLPGLQGRDVFGDDLQVWVCRNRTCEAPVGTPKELWDLFESIKKDGNV